MYKLTNNYGNDIFPSYLLMTTNAVTGIDYVPFTGTKDEYKVYTNLTLDPSANFDTGAPYFEYLQGTYENGIAYYNGITGAHYGYEGQVKVYTDEYDPSFTCKGVRGTIYECNSVSGMPATMYLKDITVGNQGYYYPTDEGTGNGGSLLQDMYGVRYTSTELSYFEYGEITEVREEGDYIEFTFSESGRSVNYLAKMVNYAILDEI